VWKALRDKYQLPQGYPARTARLDALERVRDGSMYDVLRHAFHEEKTGANEYIPLRDRRPSVRNNLCKRAVRSSAAMLFSEHHFPEVDHPDEETKATLRQIIADTALALTMGQAAYVGSVGSVALWLRVLKGRVFVDALPTKYLTPKWNPDAPDTLESVTERRQLKGSELADMGYAINPNDADVPHWWQRVWTAQAEQWFTPQKLDDKTPPQLDRGKTVTHDLGMVPLVWIRNLPSQDPIDGEPTFDDEAISTQIEIEYQLSQAARALRYAGDPLLLVKEPAMDGGGQFVRSASNAMVVGKDGDAKLVEIDGAASEAVVNFVKYLTQITRDQLHLPNVDPEKLSAAQSGRALELLMDALVQLCDQLRTTYGTEGLQRLLQMIVKVGSSSQLIGPNGSAYPELKDGPVTLKWPKWFAPTSTELQSIANTLRIHTDAGHMSQESAIGITAPLYDIADVRAEQTRITADEAKRAAQTPQIQEKIVA
jgi:hypothetical protein